MKVCILFLCVLTAFFGGSHAISFGEFARDGSFRFGWTWRKNIHELSGPTVSRTYEPMPEFELGWSPDVEPSDEAEMSSSPEPMFTPEFEREYPCRAGFTLTKIYKAYPVYKFYCIKQDRPDAITLPVDCGNNFYLERNRCVKLSQNCKFLPRPPSCFKEACKNDLPIRIKKILTCVICPNDYQRFFDKGVYKCYKLLREKPKCPPGQKFQKDSGVCEPRTM